jgi:hypothetical protein
MTGGYEPVEIEALVTDRYLESLLAAGDRGAVAAAAFGWTSGDLDRGVRQASLRLRRDLPRFHPSFRFEERLAVRLAEVSATIRIAQAAGSEGVVIPLGRRSEDLADLAALAEMDDPDDEAGMRRHARPLLIGGAVASAAISIAGAALVAWRRARPPASPMARAVRAAHAGGAAHRTRPAGERTD